MIQLTMICDLPACARTTSIPDRDAVPLTWITTTGLPLEEWWDGPVRLHFCSTDCLVDHRKAVALDQEDAEREADARRDAMTS